MIDELDPTVVCPFPEYEGVPWDVVVEEDRKYVEWLVNGEGHELDPDIEDALIELLEAS